jgi:O-antigen/teichoic acid export membrane protein
MYYHCGLNNVMKLTNHYILKKGSVLLSVKLMASALALLFHYLLAKQLSAEQFGLFSLAVTCLLFASAFAKQGLEQVTVRFIASSERKDMAKLYCLLITYALTSASVIALLIFFLAESLSFHLFKQNQLVLLIPLIAILTIIQTSLAINASALKAQQYATRALLITGFITFFLAISTLLYYPVTSAYQALLYFAGSSLITAIISFTFIGYAFKTEFAMMKPLKLTELTNDFVEIINVSKVVFVISLMVLATNHLSLLILSAYVSLEELGRYGLAVKLSLLLSYPLIVVNTITAPRYAKLYQQRNFTEFKQLAIKMTQGLFILGTLGVVVLFFSVDFVLAYFGKSYTDAAVIVKILLIGQWFNLATGSVVSMLIMSGFEKQHRRNTLIITSFNIIALFVFIPLYGVIAGAVITSTAMAIKNMTALFYVNKLIYQRVNVIGSQHVDI